jgi:hypothetical protein
MEFDIKHLQQEILQLHSVIDTAREGIKEKEAQIVTIVSEQLGCKVGDYVIHAHKGEEKLHQITRIEGGYGGTIQYSGRVQLQNGLFGKVERYLFTYSLDDHKHRAELQKKFVKIG